MSRAPRRQRRVEQPADVGRLADVLVHLVDHAHQPHPERDRRVPPLVDHDVEVVGPDPGEVGSGARRHGVVVAREQVGARADLADLLRRMAVAVVADRQRQPEPVGPAVVHPRLAGAGHVGDVVVLDPGQVPHQPGDGVGLGVGSPGQLVVAQPFHHSMDQLPHAAQGIDHQLAHVHAHSVAPGADTPVMLRP